VTVWEVVRDGWRVGVVLLWQGVEDLSVTAE
jgi:hypothetical protein